MPTLIFEVVESALSLVDRLRCRLFGHRWIGHCTYGGWPEEIFTIARYCRRCGADGELSVPSTFTIERQP